MNFLMWWCGGLAIFNFVLCVLSIIKDDWVKGTFHLVCGIWMWYIVTILM